MKPENLDQDQLSQDQLSQDQFDQDRTGGAESVPPGHLRLFLIIPVYGNWEDTLACLRKLASQTTSDFRVLIADDGSEAPPPAGIRDFGFAEYLWNPHRGFAGNCNRAAREAIARGATHLLFLNNDTDFSSRFVESWLRVVASRPAALLSPVIYWSENPSKVWFSGGKMTVWVPFFRLRRRYCHVTEVDLVCGCTLLAPVRHWCEIGGFDESFVTYFEDLDFALRAKERGISAFVVPHPDLQVRRRVSGSFRGAGPWRKQYRMLSSQLVFIRRHYRGPRRLICMCLYGAQVAAVTVLHLPRLPSPRRLWKIVMQDRD